MDVSLSNSYYRGTEVDGLMITRILKVNPKTIHIPVILVTAHAMEGDKETFLKETLADDYISKPIVNPEELIDKITMESNSYLLDHRGRTIIISKILFDTKK